jgi:gamma-glutamyltranspeptidase
MFRYNKTFCIWNWYNYIFNLGGGGFSLIKTKEGHEEFIDFREVAGKNSKKDMFFEKSSSLGGLSIGIFIHFIK